VSAEEDSRLQASLTLSEFLSDIGHNCSLRPNFPSHVAAFVAPEIAKGRIAELRESPVADGRGVCRFVAARPEQDIRASTAERGRAEGSPEGGGVPLPGSWFEFPRVHACGGLQ
jgi:hypothetical protein